MTRRARFFQLLRKRQPSLKGLFAVLVALGLGHYVHSHLMFATTVSLANRFFWLSELAPGEPLQRWDTITFRHAHPYFKNGEESLMSKVVRCLPGQTLQTTHDREFFCEGEYLGQALEKSSTGRVTPVYAFNGKIPADSYFVMGEYHESFDSRYFGLIRREQVLYEARPLF